jgi:hypothetical protein
MKGSPMTSPHPHNYLGEQTLCAIEKAMTEVWTSLQTSDPSVDWLKNGELRSLLANRLLDLAEAGVTDADELSRRTRHILKLYRAKQRLLNRDASVGNCLPTKTIGQSERQVLEKARGAAAASLEAGTRAGEHKDLTPEQEYRVRVMGEEELELLRAAALQDGLHLASLNWILASLANHGFVTISPSNDRRLRAAVTKAGYLALEMRPLLPEGVLNIH